MTIGLFANESKPEAIVWAEKTAQMLAAINVDCCVEPRIASFFLHEIPSTVHRLKLEDFHKESDIIISFGGDGTLLAAARAFITTDIPIMGVNLGNLGFLAEFSSDEIDNALSAIMTGEYVLEDRAILQTTLGDGTTIYALNDFVIRQSDAARMITVRASIDGNHVADYRADGLIISTPTGSTAYSLSNGGPIIAPTCAVLCLTPVSPHSLTLRPLVVPDSSEIALESFTNNVEAILLADGEIVARLQTSERIHIRRSDQVVKLLKRTSRTYYDLLKNKLLWSAAVVQSGNSGN